MRVEGLTLRVLSGNRQGTASWVQDGSGRTMVTTNHHVAPGEKARVVAYKDGKEVASTTASVIKVPGSEKRSVDAVKLNVGDAFQQTLKQLQRPATIDDFKASNNNPNTQLAKARIGSNFGGGQLNAGAEAKTEELPNGNLALTKASNQDKTGERGNSGGPVEKIDPITGKRIFLGNVKEREIGGGNRVIANNVQSPETRKVYRELFAA